MRRTAASSVASHSMVHWLRRSRNRLAVLDTLCRHGPATAGVVASELGTDTRTVRAALLGEGRRYASRRSLVGAGLAAATALPEGPRDQLYVFSATVRGHRAMAERGVPRRRLRRRGR